MFAYGACNTFYTGEIGPLTPSIVKITATLSVPDCQSPWLGNKEEVRVGTGILVRNSWIVTSSHVVPGTGYIEIQKQGDQQSYEARVEYLCSDCDLALLKVNKPDFYYGLLPLSLAESVPFTGQSVDLLGYRSTDLWITKIAGKVLLSRDNFLVDGSRRVTNAHWWNIDLTKEPDAGLCGGAVVYENKLIGVFSTYLRDERASAVLITALEIKHVISDISDGVYDGFPSLGIQFDTLENEQYRRYLGLEESQNGIVVTKVLPEGSAGGYLKGDDVILKVEGIPVGNDGAVLDGPVLNGAVLDGPFPGGPFQRESRRVPFAFLLSMKQCNDIVALEISRDGELVKLNIPLTATADILMQGRKTGGSSRYFIFGGIVFRAIGSDYEPPREDTSMRGYQNIRYYLTYQMRDGLHSDKQEYVIIDQILADPVTKYFDSLHDILVERVNDIQITRLEDVMEAVKQPLGEYHVIEVDGFEKPIVLHVADIERVQNRVLARYGILKSNISGDF